MEHFTIEELESLSADAEDVSIHLSSIVPLFSDLYSLEIHGSQGNMSFNTLENLYSFVITINQDREIVLTGPGIELRNCRSIFIHGRMAETKSINLWLPEDWSFLENDLKLYSQLKDVEIRVSLEEASEYPEQFFSETSSEELPELLFFHADDLPFVAPYLSLWPLEGQRASLLLTQYHSDDNYLMTAWDPSGISMERLLDLYHFLQPQGSRPVLGFSQFDEPVLHGETEIPHEMINHWYTMAYQAQWQELQPWVEDHWMTHNEAQKKMEELGFYEHP